MVFCRIFCAACISKNESKKEEFNLTIDPDKKIKELSRAIIEEAGLPYTAAQLAEIPSILAAKSRYFWCIDNQEFDLMPDVFTAEGFQTFWSGRPGFKDRDKQVQQNRNTCGDDMVPMHFGYNQIVRFTGERSAQLLTRMHDYHTYKDNGETYSGYGLYVDDLVKCSDDRWRIKTLRLTYRVLEGKLRRSK